MFCNDIDKDIEAILWESEKNWQSQLFTNVYGMNSVSELYSRKKKIAEGNNLYSFNS